MTHVTPMMLLLGYILLGFLRVSCALSWIFIFIPDGTDFILGTWSWVWGRRLAYFLSVYLLGHTWYGKATLGVLSWPLYCSLSLSSITRVHEHFCDKAPCGSDGATYVSEPERSDGWMGNTFLLLLWPSQFGMLFLFAVVLSLFHPPEILYCHLSAGSEGIGEPLKTAFAFK